MFQLFQSLQCLQAIIRNARTPQIDRLEIRQPFDVFQTGVGDRRAVFQFEFGELREAGEPGNRPVGNPRPLQNE